MKLRQTLPEAVNGYWDGGKKQVFDWEVDWYEGHDAKGDFVRIGSWEANHWFNVSKGKTLKLTLRNAMFHLRATKVGKQSKFECIGEEF